MSDQKGKSPVNIDVSVGANLEAKAEIPAEATGNLLNALTDIIRPFSEGRALKADKIRLQREDLLYEIAKRTQKRMKIENERIEPIPNRVLIPILEKASLTDIDNDILVDSWSNLLRSASKGEGANHSIYADILSKLDPIHLEYMEFLYSTINRSSCPDDLALEYNVYKVRAVLEKFTDHIGTAGTIELQASSSLRTVLNKPGLKLVSGHVGVNEIQGHIDLDHFDESVLFALDSFLLTETIRATQMMMKGESSDYLRCHRFTYLGYDFYRTCKGIK